MNVRNRLINGFLSLLLVFATVLPTFANTASAASEPLQNGTYEIPFKVLKNGTDETSVMDGYTKKPATLYVKDGSYEIDMTLTNSNWYQDFKVEGAQPETISEDTGKNERVVRFPVSQLDEKLDAYVHIIVTGIPGFEYDNKYDVQIVFDINGISIIELDEPPTVEEPGTEEPGTEEPGTEEPGTEEPGTEEPGTEEPGTEEPGTEEPGTEEPVVLEDGEYTIPFAAKHATEDRDSTMSRYLVNPAQLSVKDGVQTVALTVKDSHQITALQLEENGTFYDGEVVKEDGEANTRTYAYTVTDLDKPANANVSMRVSMPNGDVYENTQSFRLLFDVEGIEALPAPEEPGTEEPGIEEPGAEEPATEEPGTDGPGTEEPGTEEPGAEEPGTEEPGTEEPSAEEPGTEKPGTGNSGTAPSGKIDNLANGRYEIDFTFLKDGTEDVSVMDGYTEKPATLYVEDGEFTVDLTLLHSSWYEDLKIAGERPEVVLTDVEADKRVVRFPVSNLNEKTNAWVHIVVKDIPGFEYDNEYNTQLAFDVDSIKLIEKDPDPELPGSPDPGEGQNGNNGGNTGNHGGNNHNGGNSRNPGGNGGNGGNNGNEPPVDVNQLEDGRYEVDFAVYKDGTEDISVMDGYTEKPATVYVKDGEYTVDLTLTHSDWYNDLKIEGERPEVVSEDEAARKRVVRFETDSLETRVNAWVHVIVPDIGYDNKYDVQIAFDTASLNLIEKGETPPPATEPTKKGNNGNDNNTGNVGQNGKGPNGENLDYKRGQLKDENGLKQLSGDHVANAKTGDMAMIGLYAALLVASSIYFIWKRRNKRFSAN
ncbi:NEAT domain-containing protein [Shouchella clausii]|uniref:NEAT domain-containing protein n=1 Tax=Shouchella TaxID=2893057 RepID=UPI0004E62938|nr:MULTISPECIES: NEAT domain-containing protein [Shouchella]ALA53676.1 Cell surface protein IsdA, transfers heme from hemoglobin to apo-IsdC [Shouchella clausii]MBU3229752.1 NEAT domain-containing protein [Shouchella clausii]MBU3264164.1 NEAT domain-containing protein [Shouchella clausii]MBU3506653.1 NEAT domain-containing protein [Shouchella clausii]MBU3535105.1 NEAT domain-containing protein [Shouchella clausii]